MYSIRTKTTLLTVIAVIVTAVILTLLSATAIKNVGDESAERVLSLLCEAGQKNLDSYFDSVAQSVEMVSSFAENDLEDLGLRQLEAHVDRTRDIFLRAAEQTNGVLTFYYRIDPTVSKDVKGFWYTNLDGTGFVEHEVTDITEYDTEDTTQLVWFTVPKATGKPIWLPPYITDNLDVRVISYNEPIYWNDEFVGVIGIEIDYSMMAEQVDHIRLYENGYAFLNDENGKILYHPRMDVAKMSADELPKTPNGLMSDSALVRYNFEGVEKEGVCRPLSNGMRLNVTVPVAEISGTWHRLVWRICLVAAALLIAFLVLTMRLTRRITKPLQQLTEAAKEVNKGNYDITLGYQGSDEVGTLSKTFNQLIRHLKVYISDLNNLAYADALTSVHNKGAYDLYARDLQARLVATEKKLEFAICVFDCDNLKEINDKFGHDKGDIYLKNTSALICSVFQHSPVFRIGGDEFAAILQKDDYRKRAELTRLFRETSEELSAFSSEPWERVSVAMGMATFNPQVDHSVDDVARRADKLMYEEKRERKVMRGSEEN